MCVANKKMFRRAILYIRAILCYDMQYFTILYLLYCTTPYYDMQYYTALYYTILHYNILYCTIIYYTIIYYTAL